MTATDRSLAALLLEDIAAIRSPEALKTWGLRWAREIRESGARDEIAEAYRMRMEELTRCQAQTSAKSPSSAHSAPENMKQTGLTT